MTYDLIELDLLLRSNETFRFGSDIKRYIEELDSGKWDQLSKDPDLTLVHIVNILLMAYRSWEREPFADLEDFYHDDKEHFLGYYDSQDLDNVTDVVEDFLLFSRIKG